MIILYNPIGYMPFGLMYIASYLRKHGIRSRIYDTLDFKEKPTIVGITDMFSSEHDNVIETIRKIRKRYPKVWIVLGGNHVSAFPDDYPGVDQIVIGEGEQAFLDICRGEREKVVKRPLLDIDDIPMPAYHLVDVEKYIVNRNPFSMRKRVLGIISSRGCPNNCVYCSIGAVWKRSWRGRNPVLVVNEMEYLKHKYDVHEFCFLDDSMSIDRNRLIEICEELIKRRLNIKWSTPNGIAHWTLDKPLLNLMKRSGCYRITFGIESGNKTMRRWIGKPYDLQQARNLIRHANRIGLWTITTNILGFPYETIEQVNDTLKFAKKCDTDFACFYKLIPHKGTEVAKHINHVILEDSKLTKMQRLFYRQFLITRILTAPLRILSKIRNMEDFKYVLRLAKQGLKVLLNTFKNRKDGDILYG